MPSAVIVRAAALADAPAIAAIYNQGIVARTSTFETRLRTAEDIAAWGDGGPHPHLVAELEGQVVGWISASNYRPRDCYAGIAEFSVYIDGAHQGQGVGGRLIEAFIPACEAAGFWKLVSRIFIENAASRSMCRKYGFREVGIYEKHGRLDGIWRDVVIVERLLEANLR